MKIIDQIGHQLNFKTTPKRIVSVVPSQTELLYDLGLDNEVVGITKFCIHPKEWFKSKSRVGGTKNLNFDKIAALQPDLIIANKEENTQAEIEALQEIYPVFTSDITNLSESLEMIKLVGEVVGKTQESTQLIAKIENGFKQLAEIPKPDKKTVLYLIWQNPFMSIGSDTFIDDMLNRCGLINVLKAENRYPQIDDQQIKDLNPDVIFLSSEPFPFKEKHIKNIQELVPNSKVILVDGEYYSWYGSRLIHSSQYFIDLLSNLH